MPCQKAGLPSIGAFALAALANRHAASGVLLRFERKRNLRKGGMDVPVCRVANAVPLCKCSKMDHAGVLNPGTRIASWNTLMRLLRMPGALDEAVFLHLAVERVPRDPELLGGALDIAVARVERVDDGLLFVVA